MLVDAADLYVYPGAASPDYSSIANAVDSASDGDRVLVSNGSYFGDITIDGKSISILPVLSSSSFTIQGDIIFIRNNSISSANEVTISSAEIVGDFEYQGNDLVSYEINIINCNSFGKINLKADNFITNIYYSTFYKSIHLNASFEIVGNIFSTNSSYCDTLFIENANWNLGGNLSSNKIKVFANRFENYQFKCHISANSLINKIHVANNYMTSSISGSTALLHLNGSTTDCLIENNSLVDFNSTVGQNIASGDILKSDQGLFMLTLRNNLILSLTFSSSSSYLFNFYGGRNTIFKLENNYFNYNPFSVPPLVGNSYARYIYQTPYSTTTSNNIFTTTYGPNSAVFNDSTGVPYGGLLTNTQDAGKNIMDCRDIDDTQNDIGTWGGPHSWENYHLSSTGSAKIIDIDINSTINTITNGALDIKAKSINTNK